MTAPGRDPRAPRRDPLWWHLALLVAVSAVYESVFVRHGLNLFDEGWPLYAATRLRAGGTLYRDVFFVFPPGHLLCAWLAVAWDPPGVVLARVFYAAFAVALVPVLYLLGRRLMPPSYAFYGALLVAIAAPFSHMAQFVFGYRYLVFSATALWCFSQRLRTGNPRWMFGAGLALGVGICFRLTPAFAAAAGLALGTAAASRSWRGAFHDAGWLAAGFALVVAPVLAWFAGSVGLPALWREVVVRPVHMTRVQDWPIADLALPSRWEREEIRESWNALQFRLYGLLYAGYAVLFAVRGACALRARRPFENPLLLAVAVWGGVYFLRTLGRSDTGHLESALPPVCLLIAHAASGVAAAARRARPGSAGRVRAAVAAAGAAFLLLWIAVPGVDELVGDERLGSVPLQILNDGVFVQTEWRALVLDRRVTTLREVTGPGDRILDLAHAPMFYVLSGRQGHGYRDVVSPGVFLDDDELRDFAARVQADPPAAVILAEKPFDDLEEHALRNTVPELLRWVRRNYRLIRSTPEYLVMVPRNAS